MIRGSKILRPAIRRRRKSRAEILTENIIPCKKKMRRANRFVNEPRLGHWSGHCGPLRGGERQLGTGTPQESSRAVRAESLRKVRAFGHSVLRR